MITKIKHKLFFSFLLFSSFSVMAILVSLWLNNQKDNLVKELSILDEIYILALKDFKIQ